MVGYNMSSRIMWAIVGFIVVGILVTLAFRVGIYSLNQENLGAVSIPLLGLVSGIIGALYFFFLCELHARGLRLASYFSLGFVVLALVLPVVHAAFFTGGQKDLIIAVFSYYAPGTLALAPFRDIEVSDGLRIIITINVSWVAWGLVGLGIGYVWQWLSMDASVMNDN